MPVLMSGENPDTLRTVLAGYGVVFAGCVEVGEGAPEGGAGWALAFFFFLARGQEFFREFCGSATAVVGLVEEPLAFVLGQRVSA